jgi:hypothetical protein
MCYRVLGRGEDFIVGMLRAVKVGFGGARVTCRRFAGMLMNELYIKTGAGRSNCLHARARSAGVVGPLLLCSWRCMLPVKCALVGC